MHGHRGGWQRGLAWLIVGRKGVAGGGGRPEIRRISVWKRLRIPGSQTKSQADV